MSSIKNWFLNCFNLKEKDSVNWVSSPAQDLKTSSLEFEKLMELALSHGIFYQVSHMAHLACETAIKHVFAKNNKNQHPWGHDLMSLAQFSVTGKAVQTLFQEISSDPSIEQDYALLKMAWKMDDRYKRKPNTGAVIAKDYCDSGKRFLTWLYRRY